MTFIFMSSKLKMFSILALQRNAFISQLCHYFTTISYMKYVFYSQKSSKLLKIKGSNFKIVLFSFPKTELITRKTVFHFKFIK